MSVENESDCVTKIGNIALLFSYWMIWMSARKKEATNQTVLFIYLKQTQFYTL